MRVRVSHCSGRGTRLYKGRRGATLRDGAAKVEPVLIHNQRLAHHVVLELRAEVDNRKAIGEMDQVKPDGHARHDVLAPGKERQHGDALEHRALAGAFLCGRSSRDERCSVRGARSRPPTSIPMPDNARLSDNSDVWEFDAALREDLQITA